MSSVPAVPEESGGTAAPDALGELTACLEVLADYVDRLSGVLTPGNEEFVSSLWQICELVPLLIEENNQAWDVIDGLKEMAMAQAVGRKLNRTERRALRRSSGGILLPE